MQIQSTKSKIAEAEYRSKIVKQHLGEESIFPNEPKLEEFKQILKLRIKTTDKAFQQLRRKKIKLSPFLEIGSEYSLASALLVNKYKAWGIASDISLASLSKAKGFARFFKFKKSPKFVCADAYNLPFKSNLFPFILIYETLHHFPNPKPVLEEIKRVLAPNGILLIGAEPIKQSFQLKLWRRPTKLRAWEKILKFILILPFISHIGKTEVDHGILEEAFSLEKWRDSLATFETFEAKIEIPYINVSQKISNTSPPTLPIAILLKLTGGGIRVVCRKKPEKKYKQIKKIIFICPQCKANLDKEIALTKNGNSLICPRCHKKYIKKMNISILLEKKLESKILAFLNY